MQVASSEIAPARPTDRFRWSIAVYAVGAVAGVFTLIDLSKAWDFGGFLFLLLTTPIVALGFLVPGIIKAFQRRWLTCASLFVALIAYCASACLLAFNSATMRSTILWTFHAQQYKAEVLKQPGSNGLKHVQWLLWGFAGSDTTMYLAYDPTNSLRYRDPHTGMFGPLHCDEVWKVRRLENNWYAVTFYTNQAWDESCDATQPSPQP